MLNNGNVAAGGPQIVNGSSIPLGQVVNIVGRGVHDGNLILFGGGGHYVIYGGDGADLSPLADVETRGKHPRHFRVAGDLVHVANQHSDEVASFRLDASGIPSQFLGATEAPSPSYLLPVPTAG